MRVPGHPPQCVPVCLSGAPRQCRRTTAWLQKYLSHMAGNKVLHNLVQKLREYHEVLMALNDYQV